MSVFLEQIFSRILEMSIIAGYCVLAVLVLRWLFRKAPKKYTYLLWMVVAFRLVCPLTVDSAFSIFNLNLLPESVKTESEVGSDRVELPETNVPGVNPEVGGDVGKLPEFLPENGGTVGAQPEVLPEVGGNLGELPGVTPEIGGNVGGQPGTVPEIGGNLGQQPEVKPEIGGSVIETPGDVDQTPQTLPLREIDWMMIGAWVWMAGMICLTATMVTSWIRLKLRVRTAVKVRTRVFETDAIDSAFVLGIRKPTIYLPVGLDRQEQAWVLLHETSHIRRKDYLVKIIATVLTIVYWFHPLVWVAWFGMCRDMEMSCDEMALEGADAELRKAYSRTLLTVATQKRINWNAITAFGEVSVKSRIKHVLSFKKPTVWMGAVFAVVLVAVLVVFGTNGQAKSDVNAEQNIEEEITTGADDQAPESEETKTEDSELDKEGIKIPELKEPESKMDAMTNALWLKMLSKIERITKTSLSDRAGTQDDPFNESYDVEMILEAFDYIDSAYSVSVLYNNRAIADFFWHWSENVWTEGSMSYLEVDSERFDSYYNYSGEPYTGWCEEEYLRAKENSVLQIAGSVKTESYTEDKFFLSIPYYCQWMWGTMLREVGGLWQRFNGDYLGQMVGTIYLTSFDAESLTGEYWIYLEGETPVRLTMMLDETGNKLRSQFDASEECPEDVSNQAMMKMVVDLTTTANVVEPEMSEEERFATWKENVWNMFWDYDETHPWYKDYGMFRSFIYDYDGDGLVDRKFFYILEDDYGVEYLLLSSGRIIELGETYANKSYKLYGLDDTGNIVKESEPDFDGFEGDEWIHQAWESFDQMQIDSNYQLEELTFFADHYTGFVDLHPYQNQRLNPVTIKDYDGDGLNDRLFQRYNEGKNTHEVYLFFGSGEMLRLDSNVYTMMYGADAVDLTGDGINELLFTHHIIAADDNGTTFFSIFTKTNGSWERMKLPGEGWTYEYGIASSYRETFRLDVVDDQRIKVSHPDCGSSADLTVSKYVMNLEVRGMQGAQSDDSVISAKEISVELHSGLGYDVLRLYGRIGDRWESTGFSWLLGYVDGDWKVLAVENK